MECINFPGKTWEWKFVLPKTSGEVFKASKNNQVVAEVKHCEGVIICSFLFDFNEIPCTLSTKAQVGDLLTVRYLEYRIELYVNNKLCDEEWPYGNICIENATILFSNTDMEITPYSVCKTNLPEVIGSFINAEGWNPEDNVWVGDCMPFSHNGRYHVFYLKDRHKHKSKWGKGAHQWAHISSEDLVNWNIHPMAIEIDEQDEGSICTGSVICYNNLFYAFYSIRTMDDSSAPLCCSISQDGYHFVKSDMKFHISKKYKQSAVRDPKVFSDKNGLFHMLITTSIRHGDDWQGCLAHLTSSDLVNWREEEPTLLTEVYSKDFKTPWTIEPECSDYFYKDGWYYLISRSQYWMSKEPFGPWKQPQSPNIPCGVVPKMALWKNNRIIFTGFISPIGYAGFLTLREAVQCEDGTLEFISVKEMETDFS